MSARGARSRKVQQKEVEKKEKHTLSKGSAPASIYENHDAHAHWRPGPSTNTSRTAISRTLTASSNNSRTTSRSSSSHGGGGSRSHPPRTAGSGSMSDLSFKSKDKVKYQAKGKETNAPRGRGGGVPTKNTIPFAPDPTTFRPESAASYPPMPTYQKTWANFKVWKGGKDGLPPYGGFNVDQDMQHGSVLIYFKEEQVDEDVPIPSIRAELHVLQSSGSTWLNNALLYGQIDDNDVDDWNLSESASPQSLHSSRHFSQSAQRRMLGPTSPGGTSPSLFEIDHHTSMDSRAASRAQYLSESSQIDRSNSPPPFLRTHQRNPTHEIWFTAPSRIHTPQGQRLHHVAIRNFLALLHGKPIVGADIYEMLNTLQPEIQVMYDLDTGTPSASTARERSVEMITNYLVHHRLDDIRNNPKHALALLAWAEQDAVRWRQGYLESFVHLSGVMSQDLENHPDFKRLSVVTRRNLGLAKKTLQLRVMEAEEKLSSFDFDDLYEENTKATHGPVYQSYQAFRQFLVSYFTRNYGSWPPSANKTWLNRKIVRALQDDFGSLYDYLVDRDVIWNPREERASRKWEMAHRKNDAFKADLPELGITEMLVTYDIKNGYAHIPHPYPLLPKAAPKPSKDKEKKGFFSSFKKENSKTSSKETTKDAKAHLQLSILFNDATNIEKLDVNFNGSPLIDEFEKFELTTDVKHMSPREARLGRWVLLYGILQLLSTLSVDVQDLRHTEGVHYFLNTDLKRMPEWVSNNRVEHLEAMQQRSWCWQCTWDLMPTQSAPVEVDAISTNELVDHYLDSRNASRSASQVDQFMVRPPSAQTVSPPANQGVTMVEDDTHSIGEKIRSLSLTHAAGDHIRQAYERRRENEKVIQEEFNDWKPQIHGETYPSQVTQDSNSNSSNSSNSSNDSNNSSGRNSNNGRDRDTEAIYKPRTDSLPTHLQPSSERPRSRSHMEDFSLDDADNQPQSQYHLPLQHPGPIALRSHPPNIDKIMSAYPFSQLERDIQWPVPPGYSESAEGAGTGGAVRNKEEWTVGRRRQP